MEENKKTETWTEVYQSISDHQFEKTSKLVSEMLADADRKDRRKNIIIAILVIAFALSNAYWIYQWNTYDYVSQDGEGYNYYNADVEGDIVNGATDTEEEE